MVILLLGEDGADPYLHPAIQVTFGKEKAVRQAPFRILPDIGMITLQAPPEIKTEEGELKFMGWILGGKHLSKDYTISVDIKDKLSLAGYYEWKLRKEPGKNDVMRKQIINEE